MMWAGDLCLCCGTIAEASFADLVEAAAAGGFRSISIWPHHYQRARSDGLCDRDMKLMLEDNGLVVTELDCLMDWLPGGHSSRAGAPAPEDPVMQAASLSVNEDFFYHIADTLGGRHLNAIRCSRRPMETEAVAEAFAALCDRAAQHGLMVSLEFLPWSGVPDIASALGIARLADRRNGGVMLDTWHHFRSGGGAAGLLGVPGDCIVAVQLNDAAAEPAPDLVNESLHGRLLPGQGAIDLVAVVRALDAIGCHAPMGVEVFSDELNRLRPVEAARLAGQAARDVLTAAGVGSQGRGRCCPEQKRGGQRRSAE